MTFDEFDHALPNGLHDAELLELHVDYVTREAVLDVSVDFGSPEVEPPELYRKGRVRFSGLHFLVIDPPNPPYTKTSLMMIDAGEGQPSTSPCKLPPLPAGAFLCWIFVSDWNGFIRIAADAVDFEPDDGLLD